MLSGLLITLNILVCISLVIVVLMQRSEGGAFGASNSSGGLITARGAGDLLTRTTWILFAIFLVLSLALTLLGAHDKQSSTVLDKLKLQQANPNALVQKPQTPVTPAPTQTQPLSPFGAPPVGGSPAPIVVPSGPPPVTAAKTPATAGKTITGKPTTTTPAHAAAKPATGSAPSQIAAPTTTTAAPPVLLAPPPPVTKTEPPPQPKSDPNAPVTTGQP